MNPQIFELYNYIKIFRASTGSSLLIKLPYKMTRIIAAVWFKQAGGFAPSWQMVDSYVDNPMQE